MKKISYSFGLQNLSIDRYLGLSLITFHLCLIIQVTGRYDQLILVALFWWAIALNIHESSPKPTPEHSKFYRSYQSLGAFLLILLVLCGSLVFPYWLISDSWVRIIPGAIFLSWTLLYSGPLWYQYSIEWRLVLTLMIPQGLVSHLLEPLIGMWLQKQLAQIAHFLLHYGGIEASRDNLHLMLNHGSVSVEYGCAGVPLFVLLIQLIILLTCHVSLSIRQWFILLGLTTLGFFGVTSSRIALMAYVVNQPVVFDYWHSVSGAEIFSTVAISLTFLIYQLTISTVPD